MGKINDVQMFWSLLCVECVEFLSRMRSGAVLMECRHGEGQTDKLGLYQRKWSDRSVSDLVSWCFKPSQPQRIISGLRETFIKRFTVERTNKAEIRPKKNNKNKSVDNLYSMRTWIGSS